MDDESQILTNEREEVRTERNRMSHRYSQEEHRYGIGAPSRAEAEADLQKDN